MGATPFEGLLVSSVGRVPFLVRPRPCAIRRESWSAAFIPHERYGRPYASRRGPGGWRSPERPGPRSHGWDLHTRCPSPGYQSWRGGDSPRRAHFGRFRRSPPHSPLGAPRSNWGGSAARSSAGDGLPLHVVARAVDRWSPSLNASIVTLLSVLHATEVSPLVVQSLTTATQGLKASSRQLRAGLAQRQC